MHVITILTHLYNSLHSQFFVLEGPVETDELRVLGSLGFNQSLTELSLLIVKAYKGRRTVRGRC